MMAQSPVSRQVLEECNVWRKLAQLESTLHGLLRGEALRVPAGDPGRDVQTMAARHLPAKRGLSEPEGQARLLHDLGNIELQAMELAVRTLAEFPEAPINFRTELAELARDEGRHLRLCLEAVAEFGFAWGDFPVHLGVWRSVRNTDSLLDRLVIVHRFLEGSGLDATHTFLRRLDGVNAPVVRSVVAVIGREEIGHVQFGSRWYHQLVRAEGRDPVADFTERLGSLFEQLPRRLEPIQLELRERAGFLAAEVEALEVVRYRQRAEN